MAAKKPGGRKVKRGPAGAVKDRLQLFQKDAERTLKELASRGRRSRREMERLVAKLEQGAWGDGPDSLAGRAKGGAKKIGSFGSSLGSEVSSHLEALQTRAVELVGVASREQMEALSREIKRLASLLDALAKRR